jgi:hypothetical protein
MIPFRKILTGMCWRRLRITIRIAGAFAVVSALAFFVAPLLSGGGGHRIVTPSQPIPPSFFGMHILEHQSW